MHHRLDIAIHFFGIEHLKVILKLLQLLQTLLQSIVYLV